MLCSLLLYTVNIIMISLPYVQKDVWALIGIVSADMARVVEDTDFRSPIVFRKRALW